MKANLLLIDDSEVQSSQITESLERLGYSVQRAASGAEGLRLAREKSPDLILLDVVMPDNQRSLRSRCGRPGSERGGATNRG